MKSDKALAALKKKPQLQAQLEGRAQRDFLPLESLDSASGLAMAQGKLGPKTQDCVAVRNLKPAFSKPHPREG